MKKLITILILLTAVTLQAQSLESAKERIRERFDSVNAPDTVLIKNYEAKINQLQGLLQQRLNELMAKDPDCNQLRGAITILQQLIEEEKGKQDGKQKPE